MRTRNCRLVNVAKVKKLAGEKKKLVTPEFLSKLEAMIEQTVSELGKPS